MAYFYSFYWLLIPANCNKNLNFELHTAFCTCSVTDSCARKFQLKPQEPTIGNPGSPCVTRDITQVNCREHMR